MRIVLRAVARSRYGSGRMRCTSGFEKERMALVLVDIQRKFSESTEGIRNSCSERMETVNQAISRFHSTGNPVVYVRYTGEMYDGKPVADAMEGFDPALLPPVDGDAIVCKKEMNAFRGSDLESVLRGKGCDSVLIAGMVAHCCVAATYFGAFDLGFSAYLLRHGTAATDPENVEAVERICRTIDVSDLGLNENLGRSSSSCGSSLRSWAPRVSRGPGCPRRVRRARRCARDPAPRTGSMRRCRTSAPS